MNKDPAAWKVMEKYNKQDVLLLEKVYDRLLPWIKSHPNHHLFNGHVPLDYLAISINCWYSLGDGLCCVC